MLVFSTYKLNIKKYKKGGKKINVYLRYLQYCLMDHEVLSMKKFKRYQPLDQAPEKRQISTFNTHQRNMVTLEHLPPWLVWSHFLILYCVCPFLFHIFL